MRRFFKFLGLTLLALLGLLAVLLGLNFDRLVDERLRPWAATKAASALAGEVSIERMQLGWGWLELSGVKVAQPAGFRLQMADVAVRFSMAGLWRQQLKTITVRQPELEWEGAGTGRAETPLWPSRPPLQLEALRIEDGRLHLGFGENRLLLRDIAAEVLLDSRFTIDVSARLGSEPGVPIAWAGYGRWEGRPELTITDFRLSDRAVLQAPVTVAPGGETFEVSLALARLDNAATARVSAAIDRQPPWPPELGWQVAEPRLLIGHREGELSLRLETAAGVISHAGQRWPWDGLHLQLAETGGSWAVDGEIALPAHSRLHAKGNWAGGQLKGSWRFATPSPAQFGRAMGAELPPLAEPLQDFSLSGEILAAADAVSVSQVRFSGSWREGLELAGSLAGRWQEGALRVEASDLTLQQGPSRLAMASLNLERRPPMAEWRGTWRLQAADGLQLVRALAFEVPDGVPVLHDLDLRGTLAIAGNRLLLPSVQVNSRLTGACLGGRLAARLSVRQLAAGWRFEAAQLAATELEYLAADGLAGVSGGALLLAGTLELREQLSFDLQGRFAVGEALVGSWYADFEGIPLDLNLSGAWEPESRHLILRRSRRPVRFSAMGRAAPGPDPFGRGANAAGGRSEPLGAGRAAAVGRRGGVAGVVFSRFFPAGRRARGAGLPAGGEYRTGGNFPFPRLAGDAGCAGGGTARHPLGRRGGPKRRRGAAAGVQR